jgi:hypothetical protein
MASITPATMSMRELVRYLPRDTRWGPLWYEHVPYPRHPQLIVHDGHMNWMYITAGEWAVWRGNVQVEELGWVVECTGIQVSISHANILVHNLAELLITLDAIIESVDSDGNIYYDPFQCLV